MTPQIGASVSIRVPRETLEAQPGYYFVFGDTLDELADQLGLIRFYFNCRADGAATLVGELSAALNRFQTPFQLKTPTAPALYGRTDAAVLYVSARYFSIVARIVMQICDVMLLDAAVPMFTKPLWPGIGVAMEPGSGESFGSHRCRLTAEALSKPGNVATMKFRRSSRSWPNASALPVSIWRGHGWGPARSISSISQPRWGSRDERSPGLPRCRLEHRPPAMSRRDLVGRPMQLAWLGDGAAWWAMGHGLSGYGLAGLRRQRGDRFVPRPPGAAHRRSDHPGNRRGGIGASAEQRRSAGGRREYGFYSGLSGIAWCSRGRGGARAGGVGGAGPRRDAARRAIGPSGRASGRDQRQRRPDPGARRRRAARCERGIAPRCSAPRRASRGVAAQNDEGWSWDTLSMPGERHLLGLAHGASGIAWALAELGVAPGGPTSWRPRKRAWLTSAHISSRRRATGRICAVSCNRVRTASRPACWPGAMALRGSVWRGWR